MSESLRGREGGCRASAGGSKCLTCHPTVDKSVLWSLKHEASANESNLLNAQKPGFQSGGSRVACCFAYLDGHAGSALRELSPPDVHDRVLVLVLLIHLRGHRVAGGQEGHGGRRGAGLG